MGHDPFGNPFNAALGLSTSDIFRRPVGGGARGPRKPAQAAESEPEPLAPEPQPAAEETKPADKVTLKNQKWEVEEVGFNEETDISVEAILPESQAHKTCIDFELFAKTPQGPESISKCQGTVKDGKAVGRIPVYIPQYRDEEGNLLAKVEYFFTAKHSGSDLLKDEKVVKEVDHLAERLIKFHILDDLTFATGKSFLHPRHAGVLQAMVDRIAEWRKEHPDGKLAIFGHADAVGNEEFNKKLSERRAKAVHAFLVMDIAAWQSLHDEEKWGLETTQDLLKHLGHDPGTIDGKDGPKTQAAVKGFQAKKGMAQSGKADAETRGAIYKAYMEACGAPGLKAKEFDSIDGEAFAGCSEFNLVEKTQGACEKNRRVALFLLKSNKNFPIQYPCKQGDIAPCKSQVGRKGDRRTAGFGCLFYDRLILEGPNGPPVKPTPPKEPLANLRWSAEVARCGDEVKLLAESGLPDGTELGIRLATEEKVCDEAKAKIQDGKLDFTWSVRGVVFAFDENKKAKPQVEVYVEVSAGGEKYSAEKPLKVGKIVDTKPEEFKDSHQWGTKTLYTVKGHFFQAISGNKAKVTLRKKVMKTWGATYVTVKPAKITDAGGGFPWAGMRWARCPKGSMIPNEYFDKGKWHKIDYDFESEFGTLPVIKTGDKFHWIHSKSYEYPGIFAEYKWEDHQKKRDIWIKDSNKRWTGVHAIRRKACKAPKGTACCEYQVELEFSMVKVEAYDDEVICLAPGPLRSNAGLMFYDDDRIPMCAHEVGHLVGQPDEYDGGAVNTTVNGDGAKNGLDSTTLMGGNLADPNNKIKVRHYGNFAAQMRKLCKNNGGKDEEWIVMPLEVK